MYRMIVFKRLRKYAKFNEWIFVSSGFSSKLFENHKRVMSEIVEQYKNHPSVIMWSLANEPVTSDNSSDHYFG